MTDEIEDFELDEEDFDEEEEELEASLAEGEEEEAPAEEAKKPEQPEELVAALRKNDQLQGWAAKMRHQNEALQRNQQRLEARQEKLLAALAEATGIDPKTIDPDAQVDEPEPDKGDDPAGYIVHHLRKQLSGVTEELGKAKTEAAQQQVIRDTAERIRTFHEQDAARFGQEHPDYDQAEQFIFDLVVEAEAQQLSFQNPDADPQLVQQEAHRQAVQRALALQVAYARAGKSLVQATYERALELGFEANGQAAATPKPAPQKRGPADTMRERRKKAGRPLSAAPSGSSAKGGRGVASLEALAALDDEDFEAAVEGKDFNKLIGKLSAEA